MDLINPAEIVVHEYSPELRGPPQNRWVVNRRSGCARMGANLAKPMTVDLSVLRKSSNASERMGCE
jgi:hypothetical protein